VRGNNAKKKSGRLEVLVMTIYQLGFWEIGPHEPCPPRYDGSPKEYCILFCSCFWIQLKKLPPPCFYKTNINESYKMLTDIFVGLGLRLIIY
jgi:hypothetical protein